jgi:protein-S-isoprenylcysteine O-methyltransferase Ste14
LFVNSTKTTEVLDMRKVFNYIGVIGVIGFLLIYGFELTPHHDGPPATVKWIRENFGTAGLIIINIAIVLTFLGLLTYRKPTKDTWKSKTAFIAFVIALMTEMFGWPLVLFILSPIFDVPVIARKYFETFGHFPARVGTLISIFGVVLISIGWAKIHKADGLVTDGIYKFIRHPQYTGIFLFTLGWLIHWPSVITLILWPILTLSYIWLALQEEKDLTASYGEAYLEYARKTKRFIPYLV